MSYPFQDQFQNDLDGLRQAGTYKEFGTLEGFQGPEVIVNGKKLLNFCANNYLGLAGSETIRKAAHEALYKYGYGTASVPFIIGTTTVHKELEAEVSKFLQTDDTILYTSCFDANTGLFETILSEGDAVFSDELNHASIIDGVRLCKAERFRFKHSDMGDLEAQLKQAIAPPKPDEKRPVGRGRRLLIATDGVFSMDGDTAKLPEIVALAQKYGALVMVDESHASGVLGATGRGSIESTGVMARPAEGIRGKIDIITSTFGKALGGASGGFTSGRKEIIEWLRQRSRTSLFSNALAPVIAGTALWTLQNFDSTLAPARVTLAENTKYFREKMTALGFTMGGDGKHAINPVMLMDEKLSAEFARKLFDEGVYVRSFSYPVVPLGKARIRVQLSAAHTKEQIDTAVAAFAKVGRELKVIA
jgi:glycine C-acetyltransferase